MGLYNERQRSSIRAVADFKAIICPPLPKFIKCTDFEFITLPAIALIQCWAIVLYCSGSAAIEISLLGFILYSFVFENSLAIIFACSITVSVAFNSKSGG